MQTLRIPDNRRSERHDCVANAHGAWIIYTCPSCDYQLWDHTATGEMQVHNAKPNVKHSGRFVSPELATQGDIRLGPRSSDRFN